MRIVPQVCIDLRLGVEVERSQLDLKLAPKGRSLCHPHLPLPTCLLGPYTGAAELNPVKPQTIRSRLDLRRLQLPRTHLKALAETFKRHFC